MHTPNEVHPFQIEKSDSVRGCQFTTLNLNSIIFLGTVRYFFYGLQVKIELEKFGEGSKIEDLKLKTNTVCSDSDFPIWMFRFRCSELSKV